MSIFSTLQSYWQYLTTDPLNFLFYMLYYAASILLALILHEIAHGYVAYTCGDPTAKMLGRLSMNPKKHLDPIGTVFMVLFHIGWAKPVPVNPRNFSNPRRDDFLVSIAGITMNLTLYLLATALSVGLVRQVWNADFIAYSGAKIFASYNTFTYNLIYYGPTRVLQMHPGIFNHMWLAWIQRFLLLFSTMNLSLAIFNLLPIPPLDGFHILNDTILGGRLTLNRQIFQFAQMAVLLLCFSGALSNILSTVITTVDNAVINLMMRIAGLS